MDHRRDTDAPRSSSNASTPRRVGRRANDAHAKTVLLDPPGRDDGATVLITMPTSKPSSRPTPDVHAARTIDHISLMRRGQLPPPEVGPPITAPTPRDHSQERWLWMFIGFAFAAILGGLMMLLR